MKNKKRQTIISRVIAGVLTFALALPMVPAFEVSAEAPNLKGNQSVVYNRATLYDYSDQYHKDSTLRTLDLIAGKGDINATTRAAAYAQNPNAAVWEGLYFGSGNQSGESLEVTLSDVPKNVAREFKYDSSNSTNQYTEGGLWDTNTSVKAWTSWEGNDADDGAGWLTLKADSRQTFNQIKIHFTRNNWNGSYENTTCFPYQVVVKDGSHNRGSEIAKLDLNVPIPGELENDPNNLFLVATIDLEKDISLERITFDFDYKDESQPNDSIYEGRYVNIAEIELLGDETETITTSVSKNLAGYNIWAGNSYWGYGDGGRAYIYSGLVKEQLVNGQIQFNVPDGGLFTTDTKDKEVYTNVGIPFVYDPDSGYYEFNAGSEELGGYGVHFDADYDSVITDAEKASGANLVLDSNHFYAYDTVNSNYGPDRDGRPGQNHSGDGISGFFPFNSPQQSAKSQSQINFDRQAESALYHFGMNISVDFTMTTDGTVTGKGGEPITFEFAGDDDVWVFIDGQLVLDLGGIHDSVSAKIDFGANKITMWSTDSAYGSGDLNSTSGITGSTEKGYVTSLGQILNAGNTVGKIAKSYEAFAGEGNHTLTIFYLERGRGESNCKIRYNLPRVDTLDVTKQIALAEGEQKAITDAEWAALNAIDFKMRILDDSVAVTGEYALYEAAVYVGTYKTDESGYFTLKNNQTARFTVPIDGVYEIEESATALDLPAAVWKTAKWNGTFTSSGNAPITFDTITSNNDDTENTDALTYSVTVNAADTSVDTLSILCTNYISRPFVSVAGETIVIDYGLPVVIDIMANDVQSDGKEFIINDLSVPEQGTVKVIDRNGSEVEEGTYTTVPGCYYLEYALNTYMSDIEKIIYTYKVQDGTLDGTESHTYPVGVATIIPATSMYYEENFLNKENNNYIRISTAAGYQEFKKEGTANDVNQEPGVVGTLNDSTYGTDVAYLTGTGDSNGTSLKANTTSGPAAFQYTFTGTGTAFFARTSEKSGYLRVTVVDNATGQSIYYDEATNTSGNIYIDTKYAVPNATLYNIPVYNVEDLEYGTYTVTVVVAKPSQWYTEQNELYLDGVRVYNPLNMSLLEKEESELTEPEKALIPNLKTAYAAYNTDLEADVQVITLRDYMLDTQTSDEGEWTEKSQVMFTDSNAEILTASEYESNGPKQELYMTDEQAISFVLRNWSQNRPTDARLYIGAKVPEGNTGKFTVNGTEYIIQNTTDCYFDITSAITNVADSYNGYAKIKVSSDSGLISFTNLKCTGFPSFSLAGMTEEVGYGEYTVFSFMLLSLNAEDGVIPPAAGGEENVPPVTDGEEEVVPPTTDDGEDTPPATDEEETPPSDEEEVIPPTDEDTDVEEPDVPTGGGSHIGGIVSTIVKVVNVVVSALKSIFGRWF